MHGLLRVLVVALTLALALVGNAGAATAPKPAQTATPTRGVVVVETDLAFRDGASAGTGIVLTPSGQVLTNNHVIRGATTIRIVLPSARRAYSARVVGYSVVDDVALLQLAGARNLPTAARGNSVNVRVGQSSTAVGNSNGRGRLTVSTGRITGLRQTVTVRDDEGGVTRVSGLIGTSASLVPGDSGGPLLNAKGRVIGVNTIGSRGSGGYAIPINRAMTIVRQIRSGTSTGTVHVGPTAFLGVSLVATPDGLGVTSVVPDGAAAAAGIERGDVLTSIQGEPLASIEVLRAALFVRRPGDTVTLGYRDALGNDASVEVVLGEGPPQ